LKTGDFYILGIETSCDDTSAAVLRDGGILESNIISSQDHLHGPFGGIVPELASRAHVRQIQPVVDEALYQAGIKRHDLDLVAVTMGPGLVGSLLVGVNYAKAMAYALGIPFIGVNHLEGHFFSSFLEHPEIAFPLICLIVSGGHSSLYFSPECGTYELLSATRDDAAGEAYDKVAKMLGLPYPGGPVIDRIAASFPGKGVSFGLPKISDGTLDFSFSGLKTAVLYTIKRENIAPVESIENISEPVKALVKGFQASVVKQLLHRVDHFTRRLSPCSFILGGGVSCNSELRRQSSDLMSSMGVRWYFPSTSLSTDNAAMIAYAGYFHFRRGIRSPLSLNAEANLTLV